MRPFRLVRAPFRPLLLGLTLAAVLGGCATNSTFDSPSAALRAASDARLAKDPAAAAAALDERDQMYGGETSAARLLNQADLVYLLSTMSAAQRSSFAGGNGRRAGWAELAGLLAATDSDEAANAAFDAWKAKKKGHPAMAGLGGAYLAAASGGYKGQTVGRLLPTGGRFAGAGRAVRSGMNAADSRYKGPGKPSFLDRNTGGGGAKGAYRSVTGKGAELVIGPLLKGNVDAIAGAASVPTLALNQGTVSGAKVTEFALAPTDEIADAAAKAKAAGKETAVLIYPNDPWGQRLASAGKSAWGASGLRDQLAYNPNSIELGASTRGVLEKAEADVVLLAAPNPAQAAVLVSAIRAIDPGLPIIATSHAYKGSSNKALRGLYFVEIPYMLNGGGKGSSLSRLEAMGADAYHLAPRLAQLSSGETMEFAGATGDLSVAAGGAVKRSLTLARFGEDGAVARADIADLEAMSATASNMAKSEAADEDKADADADGKAS